MTVRSNRFWPLPPMLQGHPVSSPNPEEELYGLQWKAVLLMSVAGGVQGNTEDPADAMARIFVWLRYSSSRQLTWQRNYNTQPRILGSAQERLTHKMAEVRPTAACCPLTQQGRPHSSCLLPQHPMTGLH